MKMTTPSTFDLQSSILPQKRKFELDIESLLYDDMAAILSSSQQPVIEQSQESQLLQQQQQQFIEGTMDAFDSDFMQLLLNNMQHIMPIPTSTNTLTTTNMDTADDAPSWQSINTVDNNQNSNDNKENDTSKSNMDDSIAITTNSTTTIPFMNNLSDNLITTQQVDCFLQDPLMAPPSSVLPADNDWFLLDNAPLLMNEEESGCPSSPASSSASDVSSVPPATPTVQTEQLMMLRNNNINSHNDNNNNDNQQQTSINKVDLNDSNNEWESQLKQYLGKSESSAGAETTMVAGGPAAMKNERTVMIITGKVAQKSYGTEKRFLCPPPTTIVIGGTSPLNFRISAGGSKCQQSGVLDRTCSNNNYFKNTSKHLHINDLAEKRKQVTVMVDIHQLGNFTSKPIKVISKPMCIHHGSTIALFNRIRSQTVSTKYLGVNEPKTNHTGSLSYVARPSSWDPFVIWAVDGETGPIHYNQQVMLQCIKTGMMSPVMIVRKGSNLRHQTNELGDPVSQLHRVAFELVNSTSSSTPGITGSSNNNSNTSCGGGNQYLACINDTVLTAALDPVADTAIWTIIGTDCATFTFWRPDNNENHVSSSGVHGGGMTTKKDLVISPFPDVQSVTTEGKDRLLLLGSHLTQFLTVWLGDVKCATLSYSHGNDSIVCFLPSVDLLSTSSACTHLENGIHRLPIFLVRESDGTAYRTHQFYTF
ncbi:hypothetical protein INT45_003897 [Circinella minor]|uniref:Uncharacterized protein n=1 Tax=Circinella minor TaxID=1195481 RepID=A0A8H7VQ25_9FUNG|nr:hypothetical protein INT45_003897 [Circinella minor]